MAAPGENSPRRGQRTESILARTAAFLPLKDSRSSYAIEGDRPSQDRIQRWGLAIGEAGGIDWKPTMDGSVNVRR